MSIRWHGHPAIDWLFTGFIVLSAVVVSVRALTRNDLFNEAEANRSDDTQTTKATPLNRILIILVSAFIVGIAIIQFFQ